MPDAPIDPVAEGKPVEPSPGQKRLLDDVFRRYMEHATQYDAALLTPQQEEWLRHLLRAILPVVGPTTEVQPGGTIKRMDLNEFVAKGFLLEINRRFLHPMGLALEVTQHTDLKDGGPPLCSLGGVWDDRDDPEGMRYGEPPEDPVWIVRRQKAASVAEHERERHATRQAALGFVVQPIPPE
jgi:hypothetical protein